MLRIESLDDLISVLSHGVEIESPQTKTKKLCVISSRLVAYRRGERLFGSEVVVSFHDGEGTYSVSRIPVPGRIFREALGKSLVVHASPWGMLLPPSWPDVPRVEYEIKKEFMKKKDL